MRPCMGVYGLCAPLCEWKHFEDGTYSIADAYMFNLAIDEVLQVKERASNG